MFIDGFDRFDVKQGELGNCWFLAATASLCCTKDSAKFHRVVPKDNLFVTDYAGIFHFNIWQYGKWVEVVVDDRLPTWNGQLLFVHSPNNNEFWPALLEKAYAKLHGSYEALQGGSTAEAMEDLTGGLVETFHLRTSVPNNLFSILKHAFERDSLLGCSIDNQIVGGDIEGRLNNGLITGHAYSITAIKKCELRGRMVELLRIRNPWANEEEWRGPWSDRSIEVKQLNEAEKLKLNLSIQDDGEFWMSYGDFICNFTTIDMCLNEPLQQKSSSVVATHAWTCTTHEGSWVRGVNAGGCRNHLDTFSMNPQYAVEVVDADELDDDDTGTLVVALMQKHRRKNTSQPNMLTIGYYIYRIPRSRSAPLDVNFFAYNQCTAKSPSFSNVREAVGRHKLKPGSYLIIPTTFKPNQEADFLLRIYSEKSAPSEELDERSDFLKHIDGKIMKDVPVFGKGSSGDQNDQILAVLPSIPEMKRQKALIITGDDIAEEKELRELFRETAGRDLEIDAEELKNLLNLKFKPDFQFEGFGIETARSMVAMMDVDHSGKLGFEEFKKLWSDIRRWKKIFHQYDRASVHCLDTFELRSALQSAGFRISNETFKCVAMRYSNTQGLLFFDDFILCSIRLKTMFDVYDAMCQRGGGKAVFTIDEFMKTTMYS